MNNTPRLPATNPMMPNPPQQLPPHSELSSSANPYALPAIPRFVLHTSGVSSTPDREPRGSTTLPLNLVALIVSYLDEIADIARVCRTSRLLYYMTLPQLYQKVSLRSYAEIRYLNGRPEGFGSGSPFMMGLNGLVTKQHAALVEELRLWGAWKELGQEDFAKGRVPENSMMLNILLRSATDKMAKLRSFSWELSCKPLKTLYQGLAAHATLTTLTIRFPSSRTPRPAVLIPPVLNLRTFKALDIDPLCYPDDISLLLLGSKGLRDLRLHFSPRMRREAESSVSLESYFSRCMAASYKIPLTHFAMQNFYGNNTNYHALFEEGTCKSVTFLDDFGGIFGSAETVFYDDQWKNIATDHERTAWRSSRSNELAPQHVQLIRHNKNLERLYFVSCRRPGPYTSSNAGGSVGVTPDSAASAPPITPSPDSTSTNSSTSADTTSLGLSYLSAIQTSQGANLSHLLFSDLWALEKAQIRGFAASCPNLVQWGFATRLGLADVLDVVVGALPRLKVLRVLEPVGGWEIWEGVDERTVAGALGGVGGVAVCGLRWLGVGERCFAVCQGIGSRGWSAREVGREVVREIEVWGLDCMDIMEESGAGIWG